MTSSTFGDVSEFGWHQSSTFGHVENISRDSVVLLPQLVIHCFNLVCCHLQYHHYPSRHHHCPKARVWKPQSRKVKRIWQILNTPLILYRKGVGRYKNHYSHQLSVGLDALRGAKVDAVLSVSHTTFNSMMQTTLNDEFSLVAHVTWVEEYNIQWITWWM